MTPTLSRPAVPALPRSSAGWASGIIGMILFSGSLPATRAAVAQFDPMFLTFARAAIAGFLGIAALLLFRQPRPRRQHLIPLAIVSTCVVIGFPLLTAVALRLETAAHALVFIALLPLSTAVSAVFRNGERPKSAFWVFAALGAAILLGYALSRGGGGGSGTGDVIMIAAVVLCGLGYAEGGRISRELGGWQVICWALLLALPLMAPLAALWAPASWAGIGKPAWIGLGYVSVFSMFVGFVFWYRGLALGGAATVGQLQLVQPFIGLALAATLLHETIDATMLAAAIGAVLCVAAVKWSASRPAATQR